MKPKFKLGLTLFLIGFLGILTMLTVEVPLTNAPKAILEFPPIVIKILALISPTITLLIAVIVGTLLFDRVNLVVPTVSSLLRIKEPSIRFSDQMKYGAILGSLAGILILLVAYVFGLIVPKEFAALENQIEMGVFVRLFYGGFTEELLMRYGFMTLVIWIVYKITKKLNDKIYWLGIILSTLLFAIGHFPVVFSVVAHPSALFLMYIVLGNSIGGLFFGWLYWRKGLEAAFIGHMFTHIIMIVIGSLY